ncbi:Helix-turn-helix domain-containing protein [Niastella yeongjuensis]|nr:Helix-turn-helix domain-containing protein [Niastella yeongjuensis]
MQFYAGQLNTTPQNLNAACRKAVDQASAEVLAEFITSEAKRLLLYTNNTVSQIAGTLDFIDASHFIKYFKRITGQTPQSFRLASQ